MDQVAIYPEIPESLGISRYIPQKERDSYDAADFAGPDRSFPITTQAQLDAAAHLIGHAADPDAVKAKAISIAKRKGFTLPKAWQEDDKQERSMTPQDALQRTAANHDPMTGTHTHSHPAFSAQGDDSTHEHEHTHDNDNDHHHEHSEDRALQVSDRLLMSLPLMRIDAAKREVWGQATAEVPDSYGTIFGYCPDAWKTWRGNVREQHDAKKAVGNRIDLECDEQERAIYVGTRVSRGAQDTWLKVEDNVLTGYSASVIPDPEFGPNPTKWPKKQYNGKDYPYLPRYTVAELSLVDNPACPGCNIQIVRADGFSTDVLDTSEDETQHTPPSSSSSLSPLDRAGARLSSDSRAALHEMRDKAMSLCGCDECTGMQPSGEPDGDEDMERKITGMIERAITAQLSSVYARLQGIAGSLARSNAPSNTNIEAIVSGAITRAVEAVSVKNEASLSEVRAELSAVKETVVRIDNTPMPGAPIMNTSSTRPPAIEKSLPTDPIIARSTNGGATYDAMVQQFAQMSQNNMFRSTDEQLAAAAKVLATQPAIGRR